MAASVPAIEQTTCIHSLAYSQTHQTQNGHTHTQKKRETEFGALRVKLWNLTIWVGLKRLMRILERFLCCTCHCRNLHHSQINLKYLMQKPNSSNAEEHKGERDRGWIKGQIVKLLSGDRERGNVHAVLLYLLVFVFFSVILAYSDIFSVFLRRTVATSLRLFQFVEPW